MIQMPPRYMLSARVRWLGPALAAGLGTVGMMALGGLVGAGAVETLLWFVNLFGHDIELNPVWFIAVLVAVGVIPAAGWMSSRESARRLQRTNASLKNLLEVEHSQSYRIAALMDASPGQRDSVMQNLLEMHLRELVHIFPSKHLCRATYLRPDATRHMLVAWAGFAMPEKSIQKIRHGLDADDGADLSVAAHTFKDGTARMARRVQRKGTLVWEVYREEGGVWVPDPRTQFLPLGSNRDKMLYEAFVTQRIDGRYGEALGVVCFDSSDPDAFLEARMPEILDRLGDTTAPLVVFYSGLRNVQFTVPSVGPASSRRNARKGVGNKSVRQPPGRLRPTSQGKLGN